MADIEIPLPHNDWWPRDHQMQLWEFLQAGGKRAMAVWHRRAGKDEVCLHHTAVAAMKRPGNYWHCFPEFAQSRKALWDAVNPHTGRRRIDEAFPPEIRESTRDHDMQIKLVNGSTWQCIGSDSVTSGGGIGSSTAGIVFSEYALANPSAWAYYRPILEENDGWAVFITTPRGRNHAFQLYNYARERPDWFSELLTAEDTGALTPEALAEALGEYQALFGKDQGKASYRQEYLCDWQAAVLGSFYAVEMKDVRDEERIDATIEPPPGTRVHYAWDLGIGDDTAIWAFSHVAGQIWVYWFYASSGVGLEHYRDVIEANEQAMGWQHGVDYVPHDAKVRELGTGRTRVETMRSMGLAPHLVPLASLDDGINAVRQTLPLCVFHPRTESGGITALEQYRREWDDDKKAFRASAVHDWTSHPSDAFRYLALAWKPAPLRVVKVTPPQGWIILPPVDVPRHKGMRL